MKPNIPNAATHAKCFVIFLSFCGRLDWEGPLIESATAFPLSLSAQPEGGVGVHAIMSLHLKSPMGRLREFLESIAYAGMKPGKAPRQRDGFRWLGPLAGPLTRYLDSPAPSDPLYISNRTGAQRLRLAAMVAAPFLIVGAVGWAVIRLSTKSTEVANGAAATPAAKIAPALEKDLQIPTNYDVEIPEVHIEGGAVTKVRGTVRNKADRALFDVQLFFDLTDVAGSRLGAVSTTIGRMEPRSSAAFEFEVPQRNAAFALVREIRE
jgi:hypothetical protein